MAPKLEKVKEVFTYFQEDSSFKGILQFTTPLCILGHFEGEITGDSTLKIGPKAKIEGNINVKRLLIEGKIIGNVHASEKVELKSGSNLVGNVKTPNLEIDEGVIFEGQCEMQKSKPQPKA